MNKIPYDIAVIGAGPGGLVTAAVGAQLGLKVALIEGNKMGGDCLNTGCVPSKSLIAAAKSAHAFQECVKFGIMADRPQIDFPKVMAHVSGVIQKLAIHDSVERFEQLGAKVIRAEAKFIAPDSITAGDIQLRARRFVIATGSSPSLPPISGLEQVPFLTNETIFQLREQPEHLIVIGGGPIGCELAQAFLFLGSKVTILEALTIMPRDEQALVGILREQLLAQGLNLYEHAKVLSVSGLNNSLKVIIEINGQKKTITGTHLLVAAGRQANVQHLDLEKANVKYTHKGIEVDSRLRTTNKKIYAIGDVIGGYQFTHISNYHAGIVIRNVIFKLPAHVDYRSIPWVTYTTPELAHAGITTEQAVKQKIAISTVEMSLEENDRAQTERATNGRIKVLLSKKGKILGVSILAQNAGELILPWIMLINKGETLRVLTNTIVPYPTLSEISKQVAAQFYAPALFSKSLQRLVKLLKYF